MRVIGASLPPLLTHTCCQRMIVRPRRLISPSIAILLPASNVAIAVTNYAEVTCQFSGHEMICCLALPVASCAVMPSHLICNLSNCSNNSSTQCNVHFPSENTSTEQQPERGCRGTVVMCVCIKHVRLITVRVLEKTVTM